MKIWAGKAFLKLLTLPFVTVLLIAAVKPSLADGKYMISAANPLAAEAGRTVLEKGGSAVDASIAVQLVLTLVEPQSSGIGGGAFMLHYDGKSKSLTTFDGREKAPAAVKPTHFLDQSGKKMKFYDAVVGGKAVGVPGVIAMLEMAHGKYGKLPWKELFEPAIKLANEGFAISPRLHFLLNWDKHMKTRSPAKEMYYNADGTPKAAGTVLRNPELAKSLTLIANGGSKAFYEGEIAEQIVKAATSDATNPGVITLADMKKYQAQERKPVCLDYREFDVCGMGPPTSGGITSLQILKVLESFDLGALKPGSAEAVNLISEASAMAFADRGLYLGDADFVDIPVSALLSDTYLAERSKLISAGKTNTPYEAGNPEKRADILSPDNAIELPSTSHFSIVDADGNAVSMTTSVENVFGSRLMAGGFILNNQLTDFSFAPEKDGKLVNNRIEPGKRPRSSMSPTIVLNEDGSLHLVIGSPGGSRIIGYVTKTVIGVLDWGLSVQDAINLPHHIHRNGSLDLEKGTKLEAQQKALEAMGYKVSVRRLNSGLHGILVSPDGMSGGADPRREGVVLTNQ